MRRPYDDRIVELSTRVVTPFIQLFALYVIFHGHYSPGGGFQGGAILAASFLLVRLGTGSDTAQLQFRQGWGTPGGSLGTLVYLGVGLLVMFFGVEFLDYAGLPIGSSPAEARNFGILVIEVGVAIAVAATFTAIYDDLVGDADPAPTTDSGRSGDDGV